MAPAKRPLQESDPNVETRSAKASKTNSKKQVHGGTLESDDKSDDQETSDKGEENEHGEATHDVRESYTTPNDPRIPIDELPPHEYILILRPGSDAFAEARSKTKQPGSDEWDKYCELQDKANEGVPALEPVSEMPEHKWSMMRGAWIQFSDALKEAGYRNPDAFGMHIFTDWEGYGMHELVENFLVRFHKLFLVKEENQCIQDMWCVITGLIYFMKQHHSGFELFGHIDDGDRVCRCLALVGNAFLAMLNSLDRAKQLKGQGSDFKDLAIVMAFYLSLTEEYDDDTFNDATLWNVKIVEYAKKSGIDLAGCGVFGTDDLVSALEENVEDDEKEPWPKEGPDRWDFKKAFQEHQKLFATTGGKLGGKHYDITQMSRSERAGFSFDGKDPLKEFSDKDIKSGVLVVDPK